MSLPGILHRFQQDNTSGSSFNIITIESNQQNQSFRQNVLCSRPGFNPWVRMIPWRREWQPTPVFLPGKSHGQRSLPGYSPWGCKRVGHNLVTKPSPSPYPYYSESQATCWGKLYQNWEFSIEVLQSLPIWTFLHIVGPKRFLFMNESILC